jgi:Arc/MetJ-type ribon-helix-helix transcriptional regulator
MPKIIISLDPEDLRQLDELVRRGATASRSRLIQDALREKLQRTSLSAESAKLDPRAERAEAEYRSSSEAPWPEY